MLESMSLLIKKVAFMHMKHEFVKRPMRRVESKRTLYERLRSLICINQSAKVRKQVADSLDKSLRDNATIWAELSKY